jgi:hypothetical protein
MVFPPRLPNLATQQIKDGLGLPTLEQSVYHEKRLRMCVISVYLLQRLQRKVNSSRLHRTARDEPIRFRDSVAAAEILNPSNDCPCVF